MMQKNKKAVGSLEWWILIIAIIVSVVAYYVAYIGPHSTINNYIGEYQFSILRAANDGEKILDYAGQSAKYSLQQSIYDLARNGGVSEININDNHADAVYECGKFSGAYIWLDVSRKGNEISQKECFDDRTVANSLQYYFNENLNRYLIIYPGGIPADNYIYSLRGNLEITGNAIQPAEISILKNRKEESLTTAKPEENNNNPPEPAKNSVTDSTPKTTIPNIIVSYKYQLDNPKRPSWASVDTIIIHHTGDDAASKTYATLKQRRLSVHYIIDRDGTIYYVLDESKIAYHAENWNSRSIGIEIVNTGSKDMQYTQRQYDSVKNLVNDIASRWPLIKIDNGHVRGHYQVSETGKWDPSPNFDWSKIGLQNHLTLAELGKSPPANAGYA